MNKNINIPNGLSVLRLLLIIPFIWFFLNARVEWAIGMLVLSGLSDMFDGIIARKFNQVTDLGKMLDPLADKLTQGSVALCLAIVHPILWPILIIFICKEISMIIGGAILLKQGKRPCSARWYGKVATVLFYITFVTLVALAGIWHYEDPTLTVTLLSVTAVAMIYAWIRYFLVFLHILRSNETQDSLPLSKK